MTRSILSSLAALLLALAVARPASAQANAQGGAETIQNFKRYFGTYKDTPSRVEAILTLEGLEDAEGAQVVEILVSKLKEPEPEIARAAVRVLAAFKTRPPVEAMLAVLKSEKTEAVRTGILRALAEAKYEGTQAAVSACLTDKSWEVRRRALQALLVTSDATLAPTVVPLCSDPEPAVRCEALEGLARLKSPLVVEHALKNLSDPVWQVRASAILALTKVRSADAVEPLVLRLAQEEGRLSTDIGEALANLTGKEYGPDAAKWKQYWEESKATFKLPTEQAIAYLRAKREAHTGPARSTFEKSGVAEFTGIQTKSRSILFVIDQSGSMEALVVERERFEGGNYPDYSRMTIVKEELKRTIDHLEPYVNFNVVAFATMVHTWKQKLVPANVLNKSAAKDFVDQIGAIGGASKEDLAQAGLVGSANLDMGKTNTYGAIMNALNVPIVPGAKTVATGVQDKNYKCDVDTIFFLSDGRPTVGEYVDPDDILREVRTVNELRKVVIHTIAIGEFQKDFMRRMAEQNGGVFVDLGK
jgi:HEAT repeat protein